MNTNIFPKKTFFIAWAFFLSGGCGLVYEVVWTRYLADLMGATSLSQLVVLMVFMGGLALGAILIGRLVDRGHNGLACYGWLELAIGCYAVLFPWLYKITSGLFYSLGVNLEPGSLPLLFAKIITASLLIAAPSLAMGGTLPAVTRYLTNAQAGLRRNISLLYGINSLGAVAGILLGGFWVVYRYGLSGSMIYTGLVNIGLGIVILAADRSFARKRGAAAGVEDSAHRRLQEVLDDRIYKSETARWAIIGAGLSGFAAMALQVAWIRYFVIVLGATHSAFTLVVAAFIFGIGLGALLVRSAPVERTPLPLMLTLLFALTSVTLWLGTFFYGLIPFQITQLLAIFSHIPFAWPFYLTMKFGICFVLMLLPTVASGMILPICVRIASRSSDRVGRDVALVYGINTLGALLGILLTSQVLFRIFTLPRTLQGIMFIYLAGTILLAFVLEGSGRKRILAFAMGLAVIHVFCWQPWLPQQLYVGRIDLNMDPSFRYEDFVKDNQANILLEERQGPDVQVSVHDMASSQNDFRTMFINGKPDASTGINNPDMMTQVLLAHLPALLHPAPKKAFVLGVGSGVTSGEMLKFPGMTKVVTAELAAEVFEASKIFAPDNGRYWENPKHRMVIDDGKTFLRLSREKFDVIAMEPTNVWQKGMAGLFSEEFFRLVKSRLAPGGVVAQWLHIYELDELSFHIILKTFSMVFPEASIFEVSPGDVLLIGYDKEWQFEPLKMANRFYQPRILASQKNSGGDSEPMALLLREVIGRQSFKEYTSALAGPVNTDNFLVLEQAAEYGRFVSKSANVLLAIERRLDPDRRDMLAHDYLAQVKIDSGRLEAIINSKWLEGRNNLRDSLNFMLLDKRREEQQTAGSQTSLLNFSNQRLGDIASHPHYRLPAGRMTPEEAYHMLQGELIIWTEAATQLWAPPPERLQQLYDRFAGAMDKRRAGEMARNTAVSLANNRSCKASLPFFRIAEREGALRPEVMQPTEVFTAFYCEAKGGDGQKALRWWNVIERSDIPIVEAMKRDKAILDMKMGGAPPPVIYGRLPAR